MDEALDWLLGLGVPVAWLGLLVWAGYTGRQRLLHYGIIATGLLLAGMSFLLCFANAMTGEGWREGVERAGIVGMIGGSMIACVGVVMRAAALRGVVPFAAVLAGGLAGAVMGWLLGSLWVNGELTLERIAASVVEPEGRWYAEWPLAACLTPYGMWLVVLLGPRKAVWVFVGGFVLLCSQIRAW